MLRFLKTHGLLFLVISILSLLVFYFTGFYKALAVVSYSLLLVGLYYRKKNKTLHRNFMLGGIGLDLLIVLCLQIQRSAVQTVMYEKLPLLDIIHVSSSILATIFYFVMIGSGLALFSTFSVKKRKWHMSFGILTIVLRTIGLITMFFLRNTGN